MKLLCYTREVIAWITPNQPQSFVREVESSSQNLNEDGRKRAGFVSGHTSGRDGAEDTVQHFPLLLRDFAGFFRSLFRFRHNPLGLGHPYGRKRRLLPPRGQTLGPAGVHGVLGQNSLARQRHGLGDGAHRVPHQLLVEDPFRLVPFGFPRHLMGRGWLLRLHMVQSVRSFVSGPQPRRGDAPGASRRGGADEGGG